MGSNIPRIALGAAAAVLLGARCTIVATTPPNAPAQGLEYGVNRPGSDYRSFDLASPAPEICRDTCASEPTCVAFTYVNPGVQAANARCWLKNGVPQPVPDNCCVSGVRAGGDAFQASPPPPAPVEAPPLAPPAPAPPPPPAPVAGHGLEPGVNRPGSDYRSFDLPTPNPEMCRDTCRNEATCVAFTYVNPGVQSPNARCWLKNGVPQPVPDNCCVSGVRHGHGGWQANPPPPPPPPPAPTPPPAPVGRGFEPGVNRPGSDYRSFDLPTPSPEMCRDACRNESACLAFTYVNPGVQAPNARCWLKNAVPQPVPNGCCTSGVKHGGWGGVAAPPPPPPPAPASPSVEPNTNRSGGDYRSFDLPAPEPLLCRDACAREPQCRAFTYVKPGVQSPHARCWLKGTVPPPRPEACCVSGVK
jgi:hypothetical protein